MYICPRMNNVIRCLHLNNPIKPKHFQKSFIVRLIHINRYSTSTEATQYKDPNYEDEITDVSPRVLRKKPQIEPFLKNLFISNFQKDLLAFPEVLNKSEMEVMDLRVKNIEYIVSNKTLSFDEKQAELKRTKVYGAPATAFHGGYEAIVTERCKFLETLAAQCVPSAVAIKNHWFGITTLYEGLDRNGVDSLMPEIAAGDVHINTCLKETMSNVPDQESILCNAYLSSQGEWHITGRKLLKNAKDGYFVVICSVENEPVQTFLVHPGAINVSIQSPCVKFTHTPATLLGYPDKSQEKTIDSKVATLMTNPIAINRLETAAICVGLLRTSIKSIIQATRDKYLEGTEFSSLHSVQNPIANAVATLYAIESMVYFTAGLFDDFQNADIEMESGICRLYATRRTFDAINSLIECVGFDEVPDECYKFAEQARFLMLNEEYNDKIGVYIAFSGMKHASGLMAQDVLKLRNPFLYPKFVIQKLFKSRKIFNDEPSLSLGLEENLHPSFQDTARMLEYCVLRLQYATEKIFMYYGAEIFSEHRTILRLTEVLEEIYGTTASISRASRAYCIGLHMSDNEMTMTSLLTYVSLMRVKKLISDIDDGKYINKDKVREDIGSKAVKHGRSHYEHCLERVFF
ncbi:complex I assembly factor Egm, mitochondrial-like [Arctopsyche grandis]|uniref:complex I assembly factor Egm, mitochondrial-like n=1 Tax=Arctopsyche grandis TaxID=121162 RepID=UPI00406D6390